MKHTVVANIWDAISATPEEAESMKLRSTLTALKDHIKAEGWTQTDAAERLGVTQPRVSDLTRGKIGRFSLDMLVDMVS